LLVNNAGIAVSVRRWTRMSKLGDDWERTMRVNTHCSGELLTAEAIQSAGGRDLRIVYSCIGAAFRGDTPD
jgi:NAD(P)-dependent dehydrogenase (short-subunit alcohol dehydrogenase family)